MLILWIILVLISLLLSWILFSQLTLEINTKKQLYQLSIEGLGKLGIVPAWEREELLFLRLELWFWRKLEWPISKLSQKRKTPKRKKRKKRYPKISGKQFRRILSSFKVKRLEAQVSSEDPSWNGLWFPIVYGLDRGKGNFEINFRGENSLRLIISNRLIRLLWAWMKK
ncbi:MAG: hypothetical protein AAFR87_33495 [Bacteroidota bacterium]